MLKVVSLVLISIFNAITAPSLALQHHQEQLLEANLLGLNRLKSDLESSLQLGNLFFAV